MLYVFSDGSLSSNGTVEVVNGVEKGVWSSDNSSTACSFFLVYDPGECRSSGTTASADPLVHQQIGWMRPTPRWRPRRRRRRTTSISTWRVILNYMALHGEQGLFDMDGFFPGHGAWAIRQHGIAISRSSLCPSISGGVLT